MLFLLQTFFNDWVGYLKDWTLYLSAGIEAAAGVIIGLAAIEAIARALYIYFRRSLPNAEEGKETIRLRLGRWLSLALEFLVAADILRTAVAPTWDEIGKLAAIVALRTVLNFFLQQDIDRAGKAKPGLKIED